MRNGPTVMGLFGHGERPDVPPIPVLIWRDRGSVGGPIPTGPGLSISQTGTGSRRKVGLLRYGYTGDVPPKAQGDVAGTTHGGALR